MDPATRMLKKVTVEDAVEADRLLSVLMGNSSAPRKAVIPSPQPSPHPTPGADGQLDRASQGLHH